MTDMTATGLSLAPRYQQVRTALWRRIESGDWQPGQQIPPEVELMRSYSVSRGTVRQAIDALVRQGALQRQQGRGTFVGRAPIATGVMDLFRFLGDLSERGFAIDLRLIQRGIEPAGERVAKELEVLRDTPLIVIRRLVLLDGEPFRLDDFYIPQARAGGLLRDDVEHNRISTLLRECYGVRLTRQQKWLEPVTVHGEEAHLLGVDAGAAALQIESLTYGVDSTGSAEHQPGASQVSAKGSPVEFRRMLLRGDRCRFAIEIDRLGG